MRYGRVIFFSCGLTSLQACGTIPTPTPRVARLCSASSAPGDSLLHDSLSVDQKAEVRTIVPLTYPEWLRLEGIQGIVLLHVFVSPRGVVDSAVVVTATDRGFIASALYEARNSTYWPACRGSQPVRYQALLPVNFTLRH